MVSLEEKNHSMCCDFIFFHQFLYLNFFFLNPFLVILEYAAKLVHLGMGLLEGRSLDARDGQKEDGRLRLPRER
jgi:hypothetical protein